LEFERALRGGGAIGREPSPGEPEIDRKSMQFCRQVQRILSLTLAFEVRDEWVRLMTVESVRPAPSCGHLMVMLGVPGDCGAGLADLLERIERVRPVLRAAIAGGSSRKRVPMLSFTFVAPGSGMEVML
jgi:ribosome-binding factor A